MTLANNGMDLAGLVKPSTQIEVMLAIVAGLKVAIPILGNDTTCFVSNEPWPDIEMTDPVFCTVSPASGQFDQAQVDGGGPLQVSEMVTFDVTVWSRMQLDQVEHATALLTDSERGLLVLKQQILIALAGKNLLRADGSVLLEEAMMPTRSTTKAQKMDDFAPMTVSFDVKFQWDLGEQALFA